MITPDARCRACGLPMITYDPQYDTHPNCDPDSPWAAEIRAQHAAEQIAARHRGQHDAVATAPDDHAAAVAIVRAVALRQAVLSANDQTVAGAEADQLATSFYGPGATAMLQFVAGLESQFPSLTTALQAIADAVAAQAGVAPITVTPPKTSAGSVSYTKNPNAGKVTRPILPKFAGGTDDFKAGGWALVGELGPEVVRLPPRSQVVANRDLNRIKHPVADAALAPVLAELRELKETVAATPAQNGVHVGAATLSGYRAAGASQQRQLRRQGRRAAR